MKHLTTIALAAVVGSTSAFAVDGRWTATNEPDRPDRIHLSLRYGRTSSMGTTHETAALAGLTPAQIRAGASTPVRFALEREAGRVAFDGEFREGRGAGHFTFEPESGYLDSVRDLGVDVARRDPHGTWDERLLVLALLDVSTGYIRDMIAAGYRVPLEEYQTMRIFDVTPRYVRSMRALGFERISADELVSTRIHGVTPEFVREMRQGGWDLSLDDLLAFRIHGVTSAWIAELRELGYDDLDADELVSTRIFQVTPEFIRRVAAAGHGDLPMRELISMRVQGVDAADLVRRRAI